jgi:aminoglycoside phosphotransferase (APT) family kinase protein
VKKFTLELVEVKKIFSLHGIKTITSFEEIKSGSINPVFLINNKYILRFDLGNPEYKDKLKKESILFELLPKFSVPTPKLIAFDDSCKLSDYPYFIISYLPGQNLKVGFPEQNPDTKNTLSSELGALVKAIHSVKPNDLNHPELFGDINSWVDKIKKNFILYLSFVKDNKYFSNEIIIQIEKVFGDYQKISNWESIACLTHGDINPGNIKMADSHITGIFDFEYACVADPFIDFERFPVNYQLGNDFDRNTFLRSYGITNFTKEQSTRLKIYCLSQGLWEIWATVTQQFPYGPEVFEEGKQIIRNTLNTNLH